ALASNVTHADPSKGLPLLEVPDNGVLVDYVTGDDMVMIYGLNHPGGGPLEKPTLYQVGFHPPDFSADFLARIETALDEVDRHLYAHDEGPAVYPPITALPQAS